MVDQNNFEEGRSAAFYIRVSSANEKNRKSIAVQQKEMETFAQENGIDVVGRYIDGGDDGGNDGADDGGGDGGGDGAGDGADDGGDDGDVAESTSKFPSAMNRLLADAGSPDCGFNTVLVLKFSRLSRNMVGIITITSALRKVGVTVVSVMEPDVPTPTERVIEDTLRAVKCFDRWLCSEDTRRGVEAAWRRRQGC